MSYDAPISGDRVQLLLLVDGTDAMARYYVVSIELTLPRVAASVGEQDGSACGRYRQIEFFDGTAVEHEALAAWLKRKQRCGATIPTAA